MRQICTVLGDGQRGKSSNDGVDHWIAALHLPKGPGTVQGQRRYGSAVLAFDKQRSLARASIYCSRGPADCNFHAVHAVSTLETSFGSRIFLHTIVQLQHPGTGQHDMVWFHEGQDRYLVTSHETHPQARPSDAVRSPHWWTHSTASVTQLSTSDWLLSMGRVNASR